jgi:hypothetical protein
MRESHPFSMRDPLLMGDMREAAEWLDEFACVAAGAAEADMMPHWQGIFSHTL